MTRDQSTKDVFRTTAVRFILPSLLGAVSGVLVVVVWPSGQSDSGLLPEGEPRNSTRSAIGSTLQVSPSVNGDTAHSRSAPN